MVSYIPHLILSHISHGIPCPRPSITYAEEYLRDSIANAASRSPPGNVPRFS